MTNSITKENFQSEVLESKGTVLLDFFANWCGPCQMLSPILEELATERPDCTIGKVNVDEQAELAVQFGVSSIPMLVILRDGKVVESRVGVQSKKEMLHMLDI